jgi:multiple sugar transport system ATP-binding protein
MSVFENMAFGLRYRRYARAEIRRRVAEAARILGIEELLARRPKQLSGGQRQRVAMGRAIVRQPAAFLLDEPLSNLDAKLRTQMRTELSRLQRRLGTTTVYVTHDQTEAMTLGHRIALLRRGEIQQIGTPRDLYERPANLFVAGFIGMPAMNLLPARIDGDRLDLPMASVPLPERYRGLAAGGTRDVVAGIRPEHFEDAALREGPPDDPCRFDAEVELVEWLGASLFLHFDVAVGRSDGIDALRRELDPGTDHDGRLRLVAGVDTASAAAEGATAALRLSLDGIMLFDAASGERISAE